MGVAIRTTWRYTSRDDVGAEANTHGNVDFGGAVFSSGTVDFTQAEFTGGCVVFDGTVFSGGTVDFSDAKLTGGLTDFREAKFGPEFRFVGRARRSADVIVGLPGPASSQASKRARSLVPGCTDRQGQFLATQTIARPTYHALKGQRGGAGGT